MFKKVILNTGAQIAGKAITASITLLITLIIGKNLGPAGYGDFTKIFVFVGYFYTLADFGLNAIFIKLTGSAHPRGAPSTTQTHPAGVSSLDSPEVSLVRHFKPLLGLRISIGISLAGVAAVISQLLPYNPIALTGFSPLVKTGIAIASITIITQALFTTTNAFFQKILRYDLSTAAAASGYLIILSTAFLVSLTTKSILGYTTAYVLGGITFVTVAYLIIAKRVKNFFAPAFDLVQFKTFLKPAWPIGIALLFNLIYFRIDVLILSNFRSSAEVGLYGLSYQFFETALAIPIFFSNAIYPPLANLYQTNPEGFKRQTKNWVLILSGVSALLVIFLIIASFFIPTIFGTSFTGSVRSLQILALGLPFFFISALLWHLTIIFDKQKFLTAIYALGAVFNIGANLLLIPKHGYIAASVITVVSEALITVMLLFAIRFQILNFKH